MNKKILISGLIFILIISFFSSTMPISKGHSGDKITAPSKTTDPLIDGSFNVLSEWSDGAILHLTIDLEVYVYIKYDKDFLYFCADVIGDPSDSVQDIFEILFDTGHDCIPTPGHDDIFAIYVGVGNVHLIDDVDPGYSPDIHCLFDQMLPNHAGLAGAAGYGISPNSPANHRIYEMKIPLALLDISPGEIAGIGLGIMDFDSSLETYWPLGINGNDFTTWGDLFLKMISMQIAISNIIQNPFLPTPDQSVGISANISCINSIANATILYSVDNSEWTKVLMNLMAGTTQDGLWTGIIPQNPWNSSIMYYIAAYNNVNKALKVGPFTYRVLSYQTPIINNIVQQPPVDAVSSADPVRVNCSVLDSYAGIGDVILYYSINYSSYIPLIMDLAQGTIYNGIWNGTIPAYPSDTIISYLIYAQNRENLICLAPENAPADAFGYIVGKSDDEPPLFFSFHSPLLPTWENNVLILGWVNATREVSEVKNLTIAYKLNDGPQVIALMEYSNYFAVGSSIFLNYTYLIPPTPYNTTIQYNITSYDLLGNSFTASYSFIINDTQSPIYNIVTRPIKTTPSDSLSFKITLNEKTGAGIKNCTLYYQTNQTLLYPHESIHPYPNNYNDNWTCTIPNATKIILKFQKIETEPTSDCLILYDVNDEVKFQFNGSYQWDFISNPLVVEIPGNTTKIQLISDMLVTRWGYEILECTAVFPEKAVSMNLTEGTINKGNWTISLLPMPQNSRVSYQIKTYDKEQNFNATAKETFIVGENAPSTITDVKRNKEYPHSANTVNVTINAVDNYYLSFNKPAFINYTIGSTSYYKQMLPCSNFIEYYQKNGSWYYIIPAQADATTVRYYVVVQDLYSNKAYSGEFSYVIDDTSPSVSLYLNPITPTYLDRIRIQALCSDMLLFLIYGSGVKNGTLFYSSHTDYKLESVHPIPNDYQYIWNISCPGSVKLRLHFASIELETQFDHLFIYDANWNLIQNYSGTLTNIWTNWIGGSVIHLKLTTDSSGQSWGFSSDTLEFYQKSQMNLTTGDKWNGIWETEIPPQPSGYVSNYYLEVYDFDGNFRRTPSSGTLTITFSDPIAPSINNIKLDVSTPDAYQDVPVYINIHENGSGIQNATLFLSLNGGLTWGKLLMDKVNSTLYSAILPGQPANSQLKYYFIIYDNAGNSIRTPNTGAYILSFKAASQGGLPDWAWILLFGIVAFAAITFFILYRRKATALNSAVPSIYPPKSPLSSGKISKAPTAIIEPLPEQKYVAAVPEQLPSSAAPPKPRVPFVPEQIPPSAPAPKPVPVVQEESAETKELRNKFEYHMKNFEEAYGKNYLHLAYDSLTKAAEIALKLNDEKVAQEILTHAKTIKDKMDSTPP